MFCPGGFCYIRYPSYFKHITCTVGAHNRELRLLTTALLAVPLISSPFPNSLYTKVHMPKK